MAKEFGNAVSLDQTQKEFKSEKTVYNTDLNPQSIYKKIVEQVRAEWEYCYRTQNGKVQVWLNRLKLYNNQKRDDDKVGDSTLFTIHNSVLASLYDDDLSVEWAARNDGDEDVAANLNATSKYDYEEMKKAQLDYFWDWDTLFFGKGYVGFTAFDRKLMCPIPELIDPTTFQQDPEAVSMNGDMYGRNAARFGGREILLTKYMMEKVPSVFDLDYVKLGKSTRSLIDQARQSRQDAQGLNQQIRTEEKDLGTNAYYNITEWLTHVKDDELTNGQTKKVLLWLANDRNKVIRFKIMPQQNKWPIIERSIFPTSHDFYGTSVCDLVEDKQRMRAVMLNLGISNLKAGLFGRYLYDRNKIKSRGDLNFDFHKHVGVDLVKGESLQNIVQPMTTNRVDMTLFNDIMTILDTSAQKATATPDMQQGQITKQDRTLGELQKVDSKVTIRYSLAAKIFGWSEKEFWEQYYWLYKKYFKAELDTKTVVLQGLFGAKYREMDRDTIIGEEDPLITIKSKYISEAQRNKSRQLFAQFLQVIGQSKDTNMRYGLKKLAKLSEIEPEEIEQLIPATPDELKARQENIKLSEDEIQEVAPEDDHMQHLTEHNKAKRTKAWYAHVATHFHALELKKSNPELFPQQQQQPGQQQGQQGQLGQGQNPLQTMQKPATPASIQGEQSGVQEQ